MTKSNKTKSAKVGYSLPLTKPLSGQDLSNPPNYYNNAFGNSANALVLASSPCIPVKSTIPGCKSYLDDMNMLSIAFC